MSDGSVDAKGKQIVRLRDMLIALSLANLFFFKIWGLILTEQPIAVSFYLKYPPQRIEFVAIILNVLLLALILWGARMLVRRSGNRWAHELARWTFLLLLLLPAEAIFAFYVLPVLLGLFGTTTLIILAASVSAIAILVLARWHRTVVRVAATVVLLLSPFVAVTFIHVGYRLVKNEFDAAYVKDKTPLARMGAVDSGAPRILWLVFDEMDQRLTFDARPPGVKLPEIDGFRNQTIFAANAYPPSSATTISLPALITGNLLNKAEPVRSDEMMITVSGADKAQALSTTPNIFYRARALGFNTGLVGWRNPYCRVIGDSLTSCSWYADEFGEQNPEQSLLKSMRDQILRLLIWNERRWHVTSYQKIKADAQKVVTDTGLNLTLIHWPIPHSPWIYDKQEREFSIMHLSEKGYFDNLELVDRSLGELRREMEKAGIWDSTIVLLTADHWWRCSANFDGKIDRRIPFMLKLAGQKEGFQYAPDFNTVLTHDLFLALLSGEIKSPESVIKWLDQNRSARPVKGNYAIDYAINCRNPLIQ